MCPCSLCLNLVELKNSDVENHIKLFGLANTSSSIEEQETQEENSSESSSEDETKPSCSWETTKLPKVQEIVPVADDNRSPIKSVFSSLANPSDDLASVNYECTETISNASSNSSVSSSVSQIMSDHKDKIEKADERFDESSISIFSISTADIDDESESDGDIREVPDYLQQLTHEEELYLCEKANMLLFERSTVNVLQALCGYFSWFTEHPGTSKSALSDLL